MANRVIKDSIWSSKSLAKLPIYHQDQWPRWLLLADDWGCFNADPDIIKGLAYSKRKEKAKDILKDREVFYKAGMLFVWQDEKEREWGFYVSWDGHQFCNASGVDNEGKYTKHRRKTPEPPKGLLLKYLQEHSDNLQQSPTSSKKVVKPNPKPIPNPNHIPIVSDLNLVLGTKYKSTNTKTEELIQARLKDGYGLEDFKVVHRKMLKTWGADPKMVKYLRPITLYGNKFEGYLNQKEVTTKLTQSGINAYLIGQEWLKNQEAIDAK